jgi:hypothetical protein
MLISEDKILISQADSEYFTVQFSIVWVKTPKIYLLFKRAAKFEGQYESPKHSYIDPYIKHFYIDNVEALARKYKLN